MLDKTGCVGTTIKTASGRYFDFDAPTMQRDAIAEIATALGNICRFGGHCRFYSVAEHSLNCAKLAQRHQPCDWEFVKHALLHDAAEAYVGDIPKPLKNLLPDFEQIERRVEDCVRSHFGLTSQYDAAVKRIDHMMLKAEKSHLFVEDGVDWSGFYDIPDVEIDIHNWKPGDATRAFLIEFDRIQGALVVP